MYSVGSDGRPSVGRTGQRPPPPWQRARRRLNFTPPVSPGTSEPGAGRLLDSMPCTAGAGAEMDGSDAAGHEHGVRSKSPPDAGK